MRGSCKLFLIASSFLGGLALPGLSIAQETTSVVQEQTFDVDSWRGKPLGEVSGQVIRVASQQGGAFPSEVVEFLRQEYLADISQIEASSAADLFKLISSIVPQLSTEQRQAFALMYHDVVLNDPAKAVDGPSLVLLGWSLVNSGLAGEGKDFPRFDEAALAFAGRHQEYGFVIHELQRGVAYDDHALKMAMTTYLNPFWHDDIRMGIDDNACPFYRFLLSSDTVSWDYAGSYFLAVGLSNDARRARVYEQAVEDRDVPHLGLLKMLSWSCKRADQLIQWQDQIAGQLDGVGESGDVRAAWLSAYAFAKEIMDYHPSPLLANELNREAFEAAVSPEFRKQLGLNCVNRSAWVRKFEHAISFVEQLVAEFPDDAEVNAIKTQIAAQAEAQRMRQQNLLLQQERERLLGSIRLAKSALAEAESADTSAERLSKLRRRVFDFEHQLMQLDMRSAKAL